MLTGHRALTMVAVAILALTGSGCARFGPYRTRTVAYPPPAGGPGALQIAECSSGREVGSRPLCEGPAGGAGRDYALQHRHYLYTDHAADGGTGVRSADYHLAFVEFDDQGWFADRKQMEALFGLLQKIEGEEKHRTGRDGHVLIMLYAHGWKHNASPCDDNVICFTRLLERLDILERHIRPLGPGQKEAARRPVVGVYVGWRGLSLDAGLLTNLTFWTRKSAAERVGRGGVAELLTRLNDYRRLRNPDRDSDKTQLVVAGHSFGGLVIYSALSHALMERASSVVRLGGARTCDDGARHRPDPDGLTCYETASSFGDLVILVNPAFEGSLYEPLFHIGTNRCYSARQRPAMLTVTSRGDDATGVAFPLGRFISTWFERAPTPEQAQSIRTAIGHDQRYETHELRWVRPEGPAAARPAPEEQGCGCPYLEPTITFNWRSFVQRLDLRPLPPPRPGEPSPAGPPIVARTENGNRVYDAYGPRVRLVGDARYSANYPYLVVTADPEIIKDHNSIYNEPFIQFLHSFFLLHIADRRPFEATGCRRDADVEACLPGSPIPCEQSCRLPDGRSCSGRSIEGVGPRP